MATLAQIRTAVDAKLATLWQLIQDKQDAYAATHNGRFWQGLRLFTVTPSEGDEASPTIGTACPTDQLGEPWPAAIRTATLPMCLRIDVYDSPGGTGYVATVEVSVLGTVYRRAAQVGPETFRAHPWRQVDAG